MKRQRIERELTAGLCLCASRGDRDAMEKVVRLKTGRGPHARVAPWMGGFPGWDFVAGGGEAVEGGARGRASHLFKFRHRPGKERYNPGRTKRSSSVYRLEGDGGSVDPSDFGLSWSQQIRGSLGRTPEECKAARKKRRNNR